jgi:hypothetical protein
MSLGTERVRDCVIGGGIGGEGGSGFLRGVNLGRAKCNGYPSWKQDLTVPTYRLNTNWAAVWVKTTTLNGPFGPNWRSVSIDWNISMGDLI